MTYWGSHTEAQTLWGKVFLACLFLCLVATGRSTNRDVCGRYSSWLHNSRSPDDGHRWEPSGQGGGLSYTGGGGLTRVRTATVPTVARTSSARRATWWTGSFHRYHLLSHIPDLDRGISSHRYHEIWTGDLLSQIS